MGTKKPTGLSIARKGGNLTLSWKAGESYNKGQEFGSKKGKKKWSKSTSLGDSVRKRAFSLGLSSYYPSTSKNLTSVKLRVRGKKNKTWSAWADKGYTVKVPDAPKVTVSPDGTNTNVCVFSWKVDTKDTDNKIFVDVEYQSMLVNDSSVTDGSKLNWKSTAAGYQEGTGTASSSKTITEDTSVIATGSHTRWFRIRSRGPAGSSKWHYGSRVYAAPNQAVITKASASLVPSGGYQIYCEWKISSNACNPTDTMVVQYARAVPDPSMECPGSASWTDITTIAKKDSTNAISASVDGTLSDDECLFVRINTVHIDKTVYGTPAICLTGKLKQPEIVSVVTDDTTHRATITATNKSDVSDSFLVVLYRAISDPGEAAIVGIIGAGETSTTVQCPNWGDESYSFGVYAACGSYEEIEREDEVSCFAVDYCMRSAGEVWRGGVIPTGPKNVKAAPTSTPGTIKVTWDNPWSDSTMIILSWADHEDAWESTDEPEEYTVSNIHASSWNISGLETGVRWYVRVRLATGSGDNITYGPWSDPAVVDLTSAPVVPVLDLSAGVIPSDGEVTCSWVYVTTDGTRQGYAEICEAEIDGDEITYGDTIASTESAQHVTINASDAGWSEGETHYLAVRVVSLSGRASDSWSDPVPVIIAEKLSCNIESTSLVEQTITTDGISRTVNSLTDLPLTIHATGAGTGGTTTLIIERAEEYHIERPDESNVNGFEGETIYVETQTGEEPFYIDNEDLIGAFDDGAIYRIIVSIKDGLGQADEDSLEFEVHWNHQAVIPEAEVEIHDHAAYITPIEPAGAANGDTCDIYRLSADAPELIVSGAEFGTTYVDPYPTIGDFGGHRIVFKTANGDYITEDDRLAWTDLGPGDGDLLDLIYGIINFDGEEIRIIYDGTQQNTWEKDFKETVYLGGSIQGDWNLGVHMNSQVNTSMITVKDQSAIKALRRLGRHAGLCHLRTLDGASFSCDIQVQDNNKYGQNIGKTEYTLSVTRVDPEEPDGETLESWSR